jgi:FkbM family methyltransferase
MNDELYIATLKEQIKSGMYDHLFKGRTNLIFLDIGANIGLVSIYAVPYCKRIVAVEPALDTFQQLFKNTKDYQIIGCDQSALSPKDGLVEFFVNDINFTASSTVNTYGTRTEVRGRTLMSILDRNYLTHVDVAKIDAEGAEGESLSYSQILNASPIIDCYYIETHNCPKTTWEHKLGTIVGNLARCGYHKMTIEGMSITASK